MKSEYDVIVVGGGGSGLAAAVSSAENGLEVLVLEKQPILGGTTGIAVGRLLLDAASADLDPTLDAAAVAFIAGFVVGITQARLLSSCTRRWLLWPLISAAGWGALFPGALAGIGLVWLRRSGSASPTE